MIEVVYCMRRRIGLSREEFVAYWEGVHAPIVMANIAALRLAGYQRTIPLQHPYSARVERRRVMGEPYDGIARLVWNSEEDMRFGFESAEALAVQRRLADDELLFVDQAASCRWVASTTRYL